MFEKTRLAQVKRGEVCAFPGDYQLVAGEHQEGGEKKRKKEGVLSLVSESVQTKNMLIRLAGGSLFKISIYRQLETHRLTYFPRRVACLLDIWRCQCRDLFHVGGHRPYMPSGRFLNASNAPRAFHPLCFLLSFISASRTLCSSRVWKLCSSPKCPNVTGRFFKRRGENVGETNASASLSGKASSFDLTKFEVFFFWNAWIRCYYMYERFATAQRAVRSNFCQSQGRLATSTLSRFAP